jgi:hypothetical protein
MCWSIPLTYANGHPYGLRQHSHCLLAMEGSTTTTKNPTELLRIQALHQRHHRHCSLFSHIPGPVNAVADDTSCLWNLSDSQLLAYFNESYPQQLPWRLCHLRAKTKSALILACCGQPSTLASFLLMPAWLLLCQPTPASGRTDSHLHNPPCPHRRCTL